MISPEREHVFYDWFPQIVVNAVNLMVFVILPEDFNKSISASQVMAKRLLQHHAEPRVSQRGAQMFVYQVGRLLISRRRY